MKDCLDSKFLDYCFDDIDDILRQMEDVLPDLFLWQLKQSVIIEEDKKIFCRAIFNDQRKCVGYMINAEVFNDTNYKYQLIMLKKSICLMRDYSIGDNCIQEVYRAELNDDNIVRDVIYKENGKYLKYEDTSSRCLSNPKNGLSEIMENLQKSFNNCTRSR